MRKSLLYVGAALAVVGGIFAYQRSRRIAANAPAVVPHVDIARYMGRWHEIARYPNRFQKDDCVDTTATYTLRDDGTVLVLNECVGACTRRPQVARGIARVADPTTNAKLKVTFFAPFAGDYWIIDLGAEYDYAVVSDPSRRYLWILSRTPEMDAEKYAEILARLRGWGFDTERLIRRKSGEYRCG